MGFIFKSFVLLGLLTLVGFFVLNQSPSLKQSLSQEFSKRTQGVRVIHIASDVIAKAGPVIDEIKKLNKQNPGLVSGLLRSGVAKITELVASHAPTPSPSPGR